MKKIVFLFFFIYLFANPLYNSNQWKALLHYDNKFQITDKNFYISKKPSLKNEFFADIKAFKQKKYQCKFPARKLFIEKKLHIKFPKQKCPNLNIYKQKVPIDNIYLVFASENINSPSSMMGHTFFKFEGYKNNREIAHAISFFTMINTTNPIKLIYENLIPGMNGYFILRPYNDILYNYLVNENRNIWEYKLKLSPFEKKMIFYHTWELKGIKQKYYFTSYNCASVLYYILASAKPQLYNQKKLWITPLNLIKIVNKNKMIQKAELLPSDEWFIKLLEQKLTLKQIYEIKQNIKNNNFKFFIKHKNNFYLITLAKVYINYLNKNKYNNLQQKLNNIDFNYSLDLSKYKNPVKTPPERDISFSIFRDNKNYLKISFLPASHTLNDYNKEYFNESQLKIGYTELLINNKQILLNNFTIYNMINLLPFDILTTPLSYDFDLSLKRDYDTDLNKKLFFNTKIGIGYDFNILKDINLYFLLNGGIRYSNHTQFTYSPKIGMLVYEIFNSKLNLSYQPTFINNKKAYNKYNISQNIYLKNNYKFFINFSKINTKKEIEFGISKLF